MNKNILDQFQNQVSDLLIRHRSILDVLSKTQEATARINRALTKAVTECGCVQVNSKKQSFDNNKSLNDNRDLLPTHVSGKLCEHCQEVIIAEMGKNFFYLAALGNTIDIQLADVIKAETERLNTLGVFNLS